jgi:serine/threonine protein kinase
MDATHISTRTYGTIVYMPSELLLHGRMTPAVDVYSFGLMSECPGGGWSRSHELGAGGLQITCS